MVTSSSRPCLDNSFFKKKSSMNSTTQLCQGELRQTLRVDTSLGNSLIFPHLAHTKCCTFNHEELDFHRHADLYR